MNTTTSVGCCCNETIEINKGFFFEFSITTKRFLIHNLFQIGEFSSQRRFVIIFPSVTVFFLIARLKIRLEIERLIHLSLNRTAEVIGSGEKTKLSSTYTSKGVKKKVCENRNKKKFNIS